MARRSDGRMRGLVVVAATDGGQQRRRVVIACQGGGSHTAFTAGVRPHHRWHRARLAAIPNLFRAVRLEDGTYWDGLFSQNPPVRELLDAQPHALWVIQINPQQRRPS